MNENPYVDKQIDDIDDPTVTITVENQEHEEEQLTEKNLEAQIETLKTELEEWKKTVEDCFTKIAEIEKELSSSKKEDPKELQQGINCIEERFIRMKTFVYEAVSEIITESNSTANIIKISNTANAILIKLDTF